MLGMPQRSVEGGRERNVAGRQRTGGAGHFCHSSYFDLAILDYATPDFDRSHSASRLKDLAPDVPIFTISGETKFRLTRFAP